MYLASNDDYSNGGSANTISQGRYIGGGVASIFLGFGIGHAVQGRWKDGGWIHTALQSGVFVAYIGALVYTAKSFVEAGDAKTLSADTKTGLGITGGIILVLMGSRIWEMVDTMDTP